MTVHAQILVAAVSTAGPQTVLPSLIQRVWHCIARWRNTAADYYAAASMYEALAALSDAELSRRGLSRTTLARDVCAACDRRFEC